MGTRQSTFEGENQEEKLTCFDRSLRARGERGRPLEESTWTTSAEHIISRSAHKIRQKTEREAWTRLDMLRELSNDSCTVPLRRGDDHSDALRDGPVRLGVSAGRVRNGFLLSDEPDEIGNDVEGEIRVRSDQSSEERENGIERESGEEGGAGDGVDLGEDLGLDGGLGCGLNLEEKDEDVESEGEVVKVGVDDEGLQFEDEFRRDRFGDGGSEPWREAKVSEG